MANPGPEELILTVHPGEGGPFAFKVLGPSRTIGRSSKADLVLSDALLSREHARIFLEGGTWFLEDLHSRNGTRLNGKQITGPEALGSGDVMSLGGCTLTIADAPGQSQIGSSSTGELRGQSFLRPASEILQANALNMEALAETEHVQLRRFAERLQTLIEVNRALSTPWPWTIFSS